MPQRIITTKNGYWELDEWIKLNGCRRVFLVCGGTFRHMEGLRKHLDELKDRGIGLVSFSDYQPNPRYESVLKGLEIYRAEACDCIMAVGGGSAMDVAKCVKLFSNMKGDGCNGEYLRQESIPNAVPFIVMPTTAGTGSEATKYAVIYYHDTKQSVTSENCIPDAVLMDPDALKTLPLYQRKATMMDAFCHAIESFWSVNSTEQSRGYSKEAIEGVLAYMDGYLANTAEGNAGMLRAAHLAGMAINIAQTTAGHAMCYKITSLFHLAHGHAAILCDRILFPWMIAHVDRCIDSRGEEHLKAVLQNMAEAMGCDNVQDADKKLDGIFRSLDLEVPIASPEQFMTLRTSVNPVRLKNHPIALSTDEIDELYHRVLNGDVK